MPDSSDDMDMDTGNEGHDTVEQANKQPSSGPAGKQTLKRGDACLACRRRRIRCNAEKPACATCVRLKKQCVYETGKTTSRIALLKARIAELESQLQNAAPPATPAQSTSSGASVGDGQDKGTNSHHHHGHPHGHHHGQHHGRNNHASSSTSTVNPTELAFVVPSVQGHMVPISPTPASSSQAATSPSQSREASQPVPPSRPPRPARVDITAIPPTEVTPAAPEQPRLTRVPYYAQSTGPRPFHEPSPNFDFDLSFLDQPVSDLSSQMHATGMSLPDESPNAAFTRFSRQRILLETNGATAASSYSTVVGEAPAGGDEETDVPLGDSILPDIPQGRELVGGWFDPNDVPPAIRDHLLDLFFSRLSTKSLFNITLHLPRFYARLTLPPARRPHPGLLYSMYTTGARFSSQPAIKQLEQQFYEIADKQIRLAVANHDRLLDALRGMALLTNYLFAKEKYSLGYHMTGAAVRLAISCGLDRIPSSVWAPAPPFNAAIHCTLRTGGYAIPPPEDAIDLAERIYAFWAVYEVDLCTAVAYLWHTGLPMEDIRTPFPRPMIEYELGMVSTIDDQSIESVLNPPPGPPRTDTSFFVLRIKAVTLLARVLRMRQERPEVTLPTAAPESPSTGPIGSYPGSALPPFATHPTGFARIKAALDHYCDNLPPEHRAPWRWDEGDDLTLPRISLTRESSVLHFLMGNAYMQLWNVRALDADNAVAILVARRLVNVMYLFQTEPMSTGYDIFMITIWNEVAMVLVRETKRLQHLGEDERAAQIDADLGVAIAALKKWGDVDISTEHDGADIAAINGKMLEQLRLMSKEDWAEAMAESRRRYGGIDPATRQQHFGTPCADGSFAPSSSHRGTPFGLPMDF